MASEFRPGHPVAFWLFILVAIYGIYSAAVLTTRYGECEDRGFGQQHWSWWPPEWVCGP